MTINNLLNNNLFNYASKELSQDAFIAWLCSFDISYQSRDKELHNIAYMFIQELLLKDTVYYGKKYVLCELPKLQYKKIDILLHLKSNYSDLYIVIEDKTNSTEHNQLSGYIENLKDTIRKKERVTEVLTVYYKTGHIIRKCISKQPFVTETNSEYDRIISICNYRIVDIDSIREFFNKIVCNNTIVQHYQDWINHLHYIYHSDSISEWNSERWLRFFDSININSQSITQSQNIIIVPGVYNNYYYLSIWNNIMKQHNMFVEIRSLGKNDVCWNVYYIRIIADVSKKKMSALPTNLHNKLKRIKLTAHNIKYTIDPSKGKSAKKTKQILKLVCQKSDYSIFNVDDLNNIVKYIKDILCPQISIILKQ